MSRTLLISHEELFERTAISKNTYEQQVDILIHDAQKTSLYGILGATLYDKLIEAREARTEETLYPGLRAVCIDVIVYRAARIHLTRGTTLVTAKGVRVQKDDESELPSMELRAEIIAEINQMSKVAEAQLRKFIVDNNLRDDVACTEKTNKKYSQVGRIGSVKGDHYDFNARFS
jgi:hypothetical protein